MNDHSKDLKTRNLREAAIVLSREGFHTDRTHTDRLCVQLDGSPLCEVTESGGVAYRNEDIDEPERIAAKDKAYEIVKTTALRVALYLYRADRHSCGEPDCDAFDLLLRI